jgi:hypothetical protein
MDYIPPTILYHVLNLIPSRQPHPLQHLALSFEGRLTPEPFIGYNPRSTSFDNVLCQVANALVQPRFGDATFSLHVHLEEDPLLNSRSVTLETIEEIRAHFEKQKEIIFLRTHLPVAGWKVECLLVDELALKRQRVALSRQKWDEFVKCDRWLESVF